MCSELRCRAITQEVVRRMDRKEEWPEGREARRHGDHSVDKLAGLMPGQWGWRRGMDSWATAVGDRGGWFVMTPVNK